MADPVPAYPPEDLKERPPGLINSLSFGLLGQGPQTVRDSGVAPERKYPGAEELKLGRDVDQFYGDPKGGSLEESAKMYKIDAGRVSELLKDKSWEGVNWEKIDQPTADRLYIAAIAANKSPLAGLGFDPKRFAATPPQERWDFNVSGVYSDKRDMGWVDERYPSTFVHESVHRGIELLTKAGYLARTPEEASKDKMYIDGDTEEMITRGLMQRHFGDVEKSYGDPKQIARAEKLFENPKNAAVLDRLEGMAARLVQERTPMGPR